MNDKESFYMTSKECECKKVYCPSGQVVCRNIADETILVPISGSLANMERIFTLNEVGASIWRLMDGKRNVEEILRELIQEFDVAEDQLAGDIVEFVEQLKRSELIVEQSI
jgi:coenzyme PQQ biosynthesis protein PqqD